MERVARKFESFGEEAAAEREFYRKMSPAERLKAWLEICRFDRLNEPELRMKKVFKVLPLKVECQP